MRLMSGMRRRRSATLLIACALLVGLPTVASADAPPGPYFNGFEENTAGWFNLGGATVNRQSSGYVGSGYASGIISADGGWHARLGIDPSPGTCASGGGPRPVFTGPYTDWGGYSSVFPLGGYSTRLDVYLDTAWAATHPDHRFDWSSAVSSTAGDHRRDFAFNAGTEPTGFVISASNNANRCNSFPTNPGRTPIHIVASGWYTFEHTFAGLPGSPLITTLRVIEKSTTTTMGTWILADATDIIGTTVGGNRYGWFVQNEIDDLAIDNSERTGLVSTPGCEVKISNGGWITAVNTDRGSFGGNAKVSASGETSGQQQYQDHGPVQPLGFKATTVQTVICSDDRTSAQLYGTGTVDGAGSFEYQIKLTDAGEPGTNDTYGILIPGAGYASGDQKLEGGNVQIR
jgi:hypothetical protein